MFLGLGSLGFLVDFFYFGFGSLIFFLGFYFYIFLGLGVWDSLLVFYYFYFFGFGILRFLVGFYFMLFGLGVLEFYFIFRVYLISSLRFLLLILISLCNGFRVR